MTARILFIVRISILLSGITLCILGICRGELNTIFQRSVVICLECIGIG